MGSRRRPRPSRLPTRGMATTAPILELRGITKTFGSVQALDDVDFEVRSGEVMALVGDNGAGKSTLIKCVAGIHPIDDGEIRFDGRAVHIHGPKDAAQLGIEVVYQDLALCDNLDVVQNMFLGREVRSLLFRLKEAPMEERTAETLKSLSVTTIRSIRQPVASLSGGQRQSVAVARAVLWNSRVVILDEPTAALGVAQTRQVLDLVQRLAEQGRGVVIVSHNLIDVFFTLKVNVFFTAVNFDNLLPQMTQVTVMAIGVVFVLLIGEIDLSIGYLSGLCSVVLAELQLPGSGHHYAWWIAILGAVAVGAFIGAVQGSIVAFLGVPSFVVTLAGLLAWQGVIIQALGTQGVITVYDRQINDVSNYFFSNRFG